jgi:hypothetical protein
MKDAVVYPKDLIPILKRKWKQWEKDSYCELPILPTNAELAILLDVAFQATCFTEEGRRPGFRIIYYSPEECKKDQECVYKDYIRPLPLDRDRPYKASEVSRLAPAAELTRLMMCVTNISKDQRNPKLRIWGMLDVGDSWWKYIHTEDMEQTSPPPNFLTITSSSPGELSLSAQGHLLLILKSGKIFYPTRNVLEDGPVADFFKEAKSKLCKDVSNSLNLSVLDSDYEGLIHWFYNSFLERILFYIRQKQYGGTIIVIPSRITKDDIRLTDWVKIKYPCSYDFAWPLIVQNSVKEHKDYNSYFPLVSSKQATTKEIFLEYATRIAKEREWEKALVDASRTIAALTSVDGAVLMTDRFRVIGFGAEVTVGSPLLKEIFVATMPKSNSDSIESYGTRHRAAFRFCSRLEDSVAFVVSHDGGVKAVKCIGGDVFLWPDINTGYLGL